MGVVSVTLTHSEWSGVFDPLFPRCRQDGDHSSTTNEGEYPPIIIIIIGIIMRMRELITLTIILLLMKIMLIHTLLLTMTMMMNFLRVDVSLLQKLPVTRRCGYGDGDGDGGG